MGIKEDILAYTPANEQEKWDKEKLLNWLETGSAVFTRENETAHFTVSGWVVNPRRDKVLMVYHNIYKSWSWMGGHADGDENLLAVTEKEIREESGLEHFTIFPEILSVEVLHVPGHEKRGRYVSSHLHLNVTYLIEADEQEAVRMKPDENSGVAWIPVAELPEKVSEPWMLERIYSKLIAKSRK